jgi:hypothetical protein
MSWSHAFNCTPTSTKTWQKKIFLPTSPLGTPISHFQQKIPESTDCEKMIAVRKKLRQTAWKFNIHTT